MANSDEAKSPLTDAYPDTICSLELRCQDLCSEFDLFDLGEGPDGKIHDMSGEYVYGVSMIPANWVIHVLGNYIDALEELCRAYEALDFEFGNLPGDAGYQEHRKKIASFMSDIKALVKVMMED